MASTCNDAAVTPAAAAPGQPVTVPAQAGPHRGPDRTAPAAAATARTAPAAARTAPARSAPARSGPPGRRDSRRPGGPRSTVRTATRLPAHHWFAEQLMLVLSGRRPAHSLLRHVRGTAFDQVVALATEVPLHPRGTDRRAAVLASVHGLRPCADVIEACARITAGGRDRALAFRLEAGEDRRWRCSAVELG